MIGSRIIHKEVCETSSMNWAKELFSQVEDGTIFLANKYLSARGRQGRVWHLYPGQLVMTFVLKPDHFPQENLDRSLRSLTMAVAVGIRQALAAYHVSLKWPNDFVIGDKKVGGMLVEAVWSGQNIVGLIVGYSINVNNIFLPCDQLYVSATSLKVMHQEDINLPELYKDLYASLNDWYQCWKAEDYNKIFSTWKRSLCSLGRDISVHYHDGTIDVGYAKDVTRNGDLVFVPQGREEKIVPFCFVDVINSNSD
jgi:BirA family transcriptional regulator, biotin operon repressor / biotin---[acetyl-CoA-carboxylase] ligase